MPHTAHSSFQSAPSSKHMRLTTSPRPSRIATMSLSWFHQFSKPSCLADSGTRSSSTRKIFTLSFHLREAITKSRSASKFWSRGWLVKRGINRAAILLVCSEGCSESAWRKNTVAFERPRSVVLQRH